MNILMLGHSNVGKTTYMYTTYGAMQNGAGYNGFTVTADDPEVHEQLIRTARAIRRGRYPDPSDQRSVYEFTLNFNGRPFFPFQWIDYRGGALLERSSSADKQRLIEDLREADGVIVFIDSVAAYEGRRVMREIGHITTLLQAAFSEEERPLPITIVFTKFDLIPNGGYARVFEPARNLVEIISGSSTLIGAGVMVACGPYCYNVEQPVLHIIRVGVNILAAVARERVNQANSRIEYYRRQSETLGGFLSDIAGGLSGAWETNYDKARREAAAAQDWIDTINPMIEPAEHLENHLASLSTF